MSIKIVITRLLVFAALAITGVLAGCMTLDTPDSKYELTLEGFKEVGKPATVTQESTASGEVVSSEKQHSTDWTNNKDGAWGRCCRYGRGKEPDPMRGFEFFYPLDVDTAYLRIKREFGFTSRQDYAANPAMQGWIDNKFLLHVRYEATPGVHYKMRNFIEHAYGSEESSNTIEVELSKDGANQVSIRVAYYSGNTNDPKGYEASLKQRIENTIGKS
ncbi:MAG: hypothetical protein ABFS45_13820 [Pseudomonadota bacterium]